MGLTIHFSFRTPPQTDAKAALEHIERLHGFCEDRPFAEMHAAVARTAKLLQKEEVTLQAPTAVRSI